jgi:trimethylamine:corrinoid methyltransferase-like protein
VAQFYWDDDAEEPRPGNREAFVRFIKLGDAYDPAGRSGHSLLLREPEPLMEPLEAGLVLAEWAHRPGAPFAWDARQVPYLTEMGEVLGIADWFHLGAVCFAHPLRFDEAVADRLTLMAKLSRPIGLTGMQVAGATTPVNYAGHDGRLCRRERG